MTWKRINPVNKPSKAFTGTEEQTAIWDYLSANTGELVIDAKAGTGKTTTGMRGLERLAPLARISRTKLGFCAFNASVGNELKRKAPAGVDAGTIHSFMLRTLRMSYPSLQVNLDRLEQVQQKIFEGKRWDRGERWGTRKLVSLARNTGITLEQLSSDISFQAVAESLNDQYCIWSPILGPGRIIERARRILLHLSDISHAFGSKETIPEGIDFDDMLWLPYIHSIRPTEPYGLLIVDESQDLNAIQMWNVLSLADRICAIGDRNQAIYGFRGADTEALDNLKAQLLIRHPSSSELPLSICWRCPTEVIALAQRLVPSIRSSPTAPPGIVNQLDPGELFDRAEVGHLILCRTNAPLIRSVYSFWKRRIPAYMEGRQQEGEQLLNTVNQIIHDNNIRTMSDFDYFLQLREETECQRINSLPDAERRQALVRDRYSSIRAIAEECQTPDAIIRDLKKLFTTEDTSHKIRHSSIHRAKGLEAEKVFLLEPHLLPHPFSRQPWELQQELNLCYVAITRAKTELHTLGDLPPALLQTYDLGDE